MLKILETSGLSHLSIPSLNAQQLIGIETILYEYIYRALTPEEIQTSYPSLTLEQVYATILYYLHNQETVNQYIAY